MATEPDSVLHCAEISASGDDVPLIEEILAAIELEATSWRNVETGRASIRTFAPDETNAHRLADRVREAITQWESHLTCAPDVTVRSIMREDWAESWKEHFHAFRASKRLVVKPSWEHIEKQPGDLVIELDPGMCFGTGYHGTTKACLRFMDSLADTLGPVPLLDAGCGSGILSMAAHALGYEPVFAFDHDPEAVRTARENLVGAGMTETILSVADVAAYRPNRSFPVVVANILAHVLTRYAESIASWVGSPPGAGHLILSGILVDQYESVRQRYGDLGFREVESVTIDEWKSGCFVRTG